MLVEDHLDDAEALVDRVEQGAIAASDSRSASSVCLRCGDVAVAAADAQEQAGLTVNRHASMADPADTTILPDDAELQFLRDARLAAGPRCAL